MFKLTFTIFACAVMAASAAPKPGVVAPAIVTAQSSQYIARNYNALVAPVVVEPIVAKTAAYVAQPVVENYVAAPRTAAFVAQPVVASARTAFVAQPVVAAPRTADFIAQPVVAAPRTAAFVAQPVLAGGEPLTAAFVAQPVVAGNKPVFTATRSAFVATANKFVAQPAYTAAFVNQPVVTPNEFVAQAVKNYPARGEVSQPEKTQSPAELLKTAAYVAQSAQPAVAARKASEEIKTNPAAETFEPVTKTAGENGEDEGKAVNVDAIAEALAPTVLATRFAGSPVYSYYNPYIAQPVIV